MEYDEDFYVELRKKLLADIDTFGWSEQAKKGFYFFMGYSAFHYLRLYGYGNKIPVYYYRTLLKDEESPIDDTYDVEVVLSLMYTAARIINGFVAVRLPFHDMIDVGPHEVFLGTLTEPFYSDHAFAAGNEWNPSKLYTALFEEIGDAMGTFEGDVFDTCLVRGESLDAIATVENVRSVSFLTEILVRVLPMVYKALMYYPVTAFSEQPGFFGYPLFSQFVRYALSLVFFDKGRAHLAYEWHSSVFCDASGAIIPTWDLDTEDRSALYLALTVAGNRFCKKGDAEQIEQHRADTVLSGNRDLERTTDAVSYAAELAYIANTCDCGLQDISPPVFPTTLEIAARIFAQACAESAFVTLEIND